MHLGHCWEESWRVQLYTAALAGSGLYWTQAEADLPDLAVHVIYVILIDWWQRALMLEEYRQNDTRFQRHLANQIINFWALVNFSIYLPLAESLITTFMLKLAHFFFCQYLKEYCMNWSKYSLANIS